MTLIVTKSADTALICLTSHGKKYEAQVALSRTDSYVPACIVALAQLAIADIEPAGAEARATQLHTFREGLAVIVREAIDTLRPTGYGFAAPPDYERIRPDGDLTIDPTAPDLTPPAPAP